jgi:hypothetical protein
MSRCQCVTAKGTQCSRSKSQGSNYCYQHQNCSNIYQSLPAAAASSVVPPVPVVSVSQVSSSSTSKAPSKFEMKAPTVLPVRPPAIPISQSVTITKTSIPSSKKSQVDVPSAQEIVEINKVIKHINELVEKNGLEELYIDLPSMRKYQLTMADVKQINNNPRENYFMIEPQMYDAFREFGDDTEMFYEDSGAAVTGSGADLWILYKKGLLDTLKAIEKRYESIPSKTVAMRRAQIGPGPEIYSKAASLLNDPEGRRARAIRATKKEYATNVKTGSGLCNDLLSDMYRDELIELANDLDLAFPKNVTKAELCKIISQYAAEANIDVPTRIEAEEAEKILKKVTGVIDSEAKNNLDRFQSISWSMGQDPEKAYEIVQKGASSIFNEFKENFEEDSDQDAELSINILDQGQLELVISNNDIIIDWINPNLDEEELKVIGPVTYRKVLEAFNKALHKFARDNNYEGLHDITSHIFFEGFYPVRGKPGHYEARFGS